MLCRAPGRATFLESVTEGGGASVGCGLEAADLAPEIEQSSGTPKVDCLVKSEVLEATEGGLPGTRVSAVLHKLHQPACCMAMPNAAIFLLDSWWVRTLAVCRLNHTAYRRQPDCRCLVLTTEMRSLPLQ